MRLHQNILENLGCPNYYTHATADNVNTSNLQNYEENSTDWFEKTVQKLINTSHNRFVWDLCQRTKNSFSCRSPTDNALLAEELTGIYWSAHGMFECTCSAELTCNGFLWFSRQYKGKVLAHQNWMTPPKVATWKVFSVFLCDIYPPFLKTNIHYWERLYF